MIPERSYICRHDQKGVSVVHGATSKKEAASLAASLWKIDQKEKIDTKPIVNSESRIRSL